MLTVLLSRAVWCRAVWCRPERVDPALRRLALRVPCPAPGCQQPMFAVKEWIVSEPSSPYYLAVTFSQERRARQAYDQTQELLFETECELSAFCFYVGPTWYVAIVGEAPPPALETQFKHLLRRGESTTLPPDVIEQLQQRRAQATQIGPWVERHYRD